MLPRQLTTRIGIVTVALCAGVSLLCFLPYSTVKMDRLNSSNGRKSVVQLTGVSREARSEFAGGDTQGQNTSGVQLMMTAPTLPGQEPDSSIQSSEEPVESESASEPAPWANYHGGLVDMAVPKAQMGPEWNSRVAFLLDPTAEPQEDLGGDPTAAKDKRAFYDDYLRQIGAEAMVTIEYFDHTQVTGGRYELQMSRFGNQELAERYWQLSAAGGRSHSSLEIPGADGVVYVSKPPIELKRGPSFEYEEQSAIILRRGQFVFSVKPGFPSREDPGYQIISRSVRHPTDSAYTAHQEY